MIGSPTAAPIGNFRYRIWLRRGLASWTVTQSERALHRTRSNHFPLNSGFFSPHAFKASPPFLSNATCSSFAIRSIQVPIHIQSDRDAMQGPAGLSAWSALARGHSANPIRLNLFSCAIREPFSHILHAFAPEELVE